MSVPAVLILYALVFNSRRYSTLHSFFKAAPTIVRTHMFCLCPLLTCRI